MILFMSYARDGRLDEAEKLYDDDMRTYWRNDSDIQDQQVVIELPYDQGSAGFGDVFQFIRYAKRLKAAGAYVIAQVTNDKLRPLLSLCPFIDQVVTKDEPLPPHSHFYRLSGRAMILLFKDEIDRPSPDIPYLHADKELAAYWRGRLTADTNFKVGIFWRRASVRDYFSRQLKPCTRSIRLKALAPLARIPGVSFYNLQNVMLPDESRKMFPNFYGFSEDELNEGGMFMGSAAIIKNMDLVITVDTSIAHLAGALGVPVWTMLPASSCYRWFRDRSDSPWYPTMRLFRQKDYSKWDDVIQQVRDELAQLVGQTQSAKK